VAGHATSTRRMAPLVVCGLAASPISVASAGTKRVPDISRTRGLAAVAWAGFWSSRHRASAAVFLSTAATLLRRRCVCQRNVRCLRLGGSSRLAGASSPHRLSSGERQEVQRCATVASAVDIPQAAPAGSAPAWRQKYWFPVASVNELDPLRPTPVRIDGLDLVVWHEPSAPSREAASTEHVDDGRWHVFADSCPHRLAPLSEGRLEPKTGCLQCAYHGWEFDAGGHCTRIPQVAEEMAVPMRNSPRARATAFPVEVAFGCIWVWLGQELPVGHPRDLGKGTDLEEQVFEVSYTRDIPYGYDSLLENFVDVSHIPFAHHGLQGSRDDARPVSMSLPDLSPDEYKSLMRFTFEDHTMGMDRQGGFSLRSPFFFAYAFQMQNPEGGEGRFSKLSICCVPVEPGRSRMIIVTGRTPSQEDGGWRSALRSALPQWGIHLLNNRFIDSDLAFLHYQERRLRCGPEGALGWNKSYYMPGEADRSIGTWRRWLSQEGARVVLPGPGSELPPAELRRAVLLDRFTQHTAHCRHCQQGLQDIESWQRITGVAGIAALILERLQLGPTEPLLICQVLAIVLVAGLGRLKQEFHFVDYQHYKT